MFSQMSALESLRLPAGRSLAGGGFVRAVLLGLSLWACAALISAGQGQLLSVYRGQPQSWWPSFAYTLAIFSIWFGLAPFGIALARRALRLRGPARIACLLLGFPLAITIHVALFTAIFRPIYGGQLNLAEMATRVLVANLDTAAFAYALLIAIAALRERKADPDGDHGSDASPADKDETGLWLREAGIARFLDFDSIDWVAAAGDYVEVHAGERIFLADHSLLELESLLAWHEFARIHRGAIVNVRKIREVRRLGRGDAQIILSTGTELRLSRRYRANLASFLPL